MCNQRFVLEMKQMTVVSGETTPTQTSGCASWRGAGSAGDAQRQHQRSLFGATGADQSILSEQRLSKRTVG